VSPRSPRPTQHCAFEPAQYKRILGIGPEHPTLRPRRTQRVSGIPRDKGERSLVTRKCFGKKRGPSRATDPGDRFHAVAEEGVPVRDIAEIIGQGLNVPVISLSAAEAPEHFGWLAMFAGRDVPASSAHTREKLGWNPTGPGLISDLKNMRYFAN
jgi:hypothetical protein